ncbi:MAG: hypothetical protein ACJAZ9_000443 [Neolewinella sp.]|jgi:hypothetical protein
MPRAQQAREIISCRFRTVQSANDEFNAPKLLASKAYIYRLTTWIFIK